MWKVLSAATVAMLVGFAAGQAAAKDVLDVLYPYPSLFKGMHEDMTARFMEANPGIEVRFRAPAEDYEDATQQVLRGAVAGKMPDVAFHGLNRARIFVDRNLAVSFDPLIANEKDWSKKGYSDATVSLGMVGKAVYGLPFAVSTPVLYINADLVKRAGGDPNNFPKTWPEIIALGKKISALGDGLTGLQVEYTITGNWMFQALVFSHGGQMLTADEKSVAFSEPPGLSGLKVLQQAAAEAGMQDLSSAQARAGFSAGRIGIFVDSTAFLGTVTRQVEGRFDVRTMAFPISAANGKLPAGGNAVMIFTKDPAKQKAAWEYVKFVTGPIGQTLMVKHTGYMPSNDIAIKDPEYLGKFYQGSPNHRTSIQQLPSVTAWYAFPGDKALKITDVIKDHLQTVVARKQSPEQVITVMAKDVQALLPK